MADYTPPLDDQLFLLDQVLDVARLYALPRYAHVDPDTVAAVLAEGARFAAGVLAPLNRTGDEEGCRLVDGNVITPAGFATAYRAFADGGWHGLDLPVGQGGQDLPLIVQAAFAEMVNGACLAFGMLPLMQRAAAHLLLEHAPPELAATVVPRLVAGEWGATICISEPQAGSDVGRIRTRAVARPDGSYLVTGTKIWITFADHDLTGQIVHLLLARTPGAPAGTRGLSLFLVPKRLFAADGSPGERNPARVARIEHKMGLKASPTCVLDLEEAVGYRVGAEGAGLKTMFTMVNLMRLEVGIQGAAVAGAATAKAFAYAAGRPQGGAPDAPPVPIIEHADVRRMLFTMRARSSAWRALVLEAALHLDLARAAPDAAGREEAALFAEWLLPVCKAGASEAGFEVASLAVQVLGGHGYVGEGGVEQYVRDARVQAIYEGANGIQALDLVTRKLAREGARRYRLFAGRVRATLDTHAGDASLAIPVAGLHDALGRLDACTAVLAGRVTSSPRDAEAGASAYLQLVGLVACGWMWLRMAAAARGDTPADRMRRATANYHAEYLLPDALALERRVLAGAASLDALAASELASA